MTIPTGPAEVSPARNAPVQVIGYAGIGTDYFVPTGVKVLLGFLAAFHLMLGLPLIVWPIVAVVMDRISRGFFDAENFIGVAIGIALGAPSTWCGMAMLVKRRRRTWRAIHAILAVLCGLELLAFIGGAVLAIMYKRASGWDQLGLVFGLFLAAAASVLFWLHATTKLALLHASVRRAFLFERDEPIRLQRTGTMAMMSLYGFLLATGAAWFMLR